jgi:hypothetical protein
VASSIIKKPIVRDVVITERELPLLIKRSVFKSQFGHIQLYDSVDFRLLTEADYLIALLKKPHKDLLSRSYRLAGWIKEYHLWDENYYACDFDIIDKIVQIRPTRGSRKGKWEKIGLATLTKTFS